MKLIYILMPVILLTGPSLESAPKRYQGDDTAILLAELRDSVDDLRRDVRNHESEIRTFEEKYSTQEHVFDSLKQELKESSAAQKEFFKNNSGSLETKMGVLEANNKSLLSDLKQFKERYGDMQDLLKQYKDRLAALEKSIDMQNKNIENLQQAVNTLADAMAPPATSTSASGKIYRVKSGDSLGTIARDNRTTVKAIKDLNNLSKDQIVVGQSLRLPE